MEIAQLAVWAQQIVGLSLTEAQLAAFERYASELLAWNARFNLTAITAPEQIIVRHFLDSLTVLLALREVGDPLEPLAVIDVGSGAGFPGLVLRMVCPQMQLTLADSVGKKCDFMRHMAATLGLEGVQVLHSRAEDLGRDPAHRERYDWALARGVARLNVLAEYLLPLVRVGGHVLAQKGSGVQDEVAQAASALERLGGDPQPGIQSVQLPDVDSPHYLVRIRKVAATPAQYPRRPGIPAKRPLGNG